MVVRVALVVLLSACGRFGFDDGSGATTLHASISAAPGIVVVDVDAHVMFASIDPDALYAISAPLPADTSISLPASSGPLTIVVDARDTRGRSLSATATTDIVALADNAVSIVLGADLPPACVDDVAESFESDVDCGGSCPACGVGRACLVPADCTTGNCAMGSCEPASGPPSWLPIADMPRPRIGLAAITATDGRIYVFGGSLNDGMVQYAEVDVYDPIRELWGSAPVLHTPRERIAGAMDGSGIIYAIGGRSNSTVVEQWQPGDVQWTTAPSLPGAGRGFIAATTDDAGIVHAIGGSVSGTPSAEHDVLVNGVWSASTSLPVPDGNMAAARATDGTLVVAGGPGVATTNGFDVATGVWTALPAMNQARSDLSAVVGRDGRIYTIGGFAGVDGLHGVEAMRLGGGWVAVAPLSTGRDSNAAAVSPDGRIFVFGGRAFSVPGDAQTSAEAYGPRVQLGAESGTAGDALVITCANFAATARLAVYVDARPVELGHSDAGGTATITVAVPALAPGIHAVRVVDDRSLYPITLPFTID